MSTVDEKQNRNIRKPSLVVRAAKHLALPLDRKGAAAFCAFFFYSIWIHFNFWSFNAISVGEAASSLSYSTSVYVNGVALIICAIFWRTYEKHAFDSGTVVASIFLCTLGTLFTMANGLLVAPNAVVDIAAGSMSGIGSAALLLMLAKLLTQNGSYTSCVLFAFILANAVAVPMAFIPPVVLLLIVVLMPALSMACAFYARTPDNTLVPVPVNKEDARIMLPLVVRAVIFVLVVYVCVGASTSFAQGIGAQPDGTALLSATALVTVAFVVSCYSEGQKLNVVSLYRTVFYFALIAIFSIPFFIGNNDIPYGIIAVLSTVTRAFIFILEYRICVKTGLSPIIVFGIGETIKKIPGMILRLVLPLLPFDLVYVDPTANFKVFIVLGLILAAVYLFVFTEKNLLQLSKDDRTMGAQETIDKARTKTATEYHLTERETEIFLHLCEGRSAPWIAKELYLSQSTVNVHVKNIYRKCDVHSRQELLDLNK